MSSIARFLRHPAVGCELIEHGERLAAAHLATPAAEDQLLRLHEKLDLADAAAPELDVVAGHDDFREAAHSMDLPLHRMDVGNGRIIEIAPPDEWLEFMQEVVAESRRNRRWGAPL